MDVIADRDGQLLAQGHEHLTYAWLSRLPFVMDPRVLIH
jgi:hypothetical protein